MAQGAPKGNQFWRWRSKHGRDKIFASGQAIIDAALEYLDKLDENPLMEHDFVGKDAMEVEKRKKHVPTWPGFSVFCHVHIGYFQQLRQDYKNSEDPVKKDIYEAVTHVDSLFYHDKFAAASAGLANPSLIGKDLGLGDKLTVAQESKAGEMSPEEIKELAELLKEAKEKGLID